MPVHTAGRIHRVRWLGLKRLCSEIRLWYELHTSISFIDYFYYLDQDNIHAFIEKKSNQIGRQIVQNHNREMKDRKKWNKW